MDRLPSFYDADKKIWSGPKRTVVYHPDASVGQLICRQLKNWPNNISQINHADGSVLTNIEIYKFSVQIAQYFKKLELRNDDVVGLMGRNTTYVVPVANACLFNTSPINVLNPSLQPDTVKHLFSLTKPKVIFCDGDVYEKVLNATASFKPLIYTLIDHIEGVPKVEDLLQPSPMDMFYTPVELTQGPDQTVAILCSSGTTGMPKAVCISNETTKNIQDGILNSEDVVFGTSSLDWISGLFLYLASMLLGSKRVIINKPFEAETFLDIVEKHKVTWTILPPRHLNSLVISPHAKPERVQTMRLISCGGGAISMPTLEKAQSLFKNAIVNFGYGFTEFGGVSNNVGLDYGTSVGKLAAGVQARIVDDYGKSLGPNEVGEILVKRPFGWAGYHGNPIETQKMMDTLGWFHTGDIGYFDDKHFLYIVDRKKDVLKYQGMQYWTTEIEEVVQKMPGIADACVFGVYNEKVGDEAGALVVKAKGSELTADDVINYVAKQLPDKFKHLHAGVAFVDCLPQNENGKTLKQKAKEMFRAIKKSENGNVER